MLTVSRDPNDDAIIARVQFGDPHALFLITERIRNLFDLSADWADIGQSLKTDPELARRVEAAPGLRVPGCWDGFELAVRAILGQQVTVKGATTLAGRLARAFGAPFPAASGVTHLFPAATVLANANVASIGLPAGRAETIRALAGAVSEGKISFEGVVDSDVFLARLCEIPGIGSGRHNTWPCVR